MSFLIFFFFLWFVKIIDILDVLVLYTLQSVIDLRAIGSTLIPKEGWLSIGYLIIYFILKINFYLRSYHIFICVLHIVNSIIEL
jgi:hypothetical protein